MNSFKKKSKKIKKKHDKKGKKDKKRRRRSSSSSSSSDSSSSSSSSSDSDKHKQRKHKKDHKRKKARRYEDKSRDGESSKSQSIVALPNQPKSDDDNDFSIPIHLMDNNHKKPETKEEYEKRQSILRRVVDEETGRTRLIKGTVCSLDSRSSEFCILLKDPE
jgi:hypothetical protein